MQFFLPCPGFEQNEWSKYLKDLLFVDYEEMSAREKAKIDEAIEHGDLYVGQYTKLASGIQVFSTDLGSPEENARVEVRVPPYVDKEKAVFLLRDVVEKLMEI